MRLLSLAFILLLVSCGSDNPDQLTINFKLKYDNAPMVMFQNYEYPDGRDFEITRFSFFVSDLLLLDASGTSTLREVDYLDLTVAHSDLNSAEQGFDWVIDDIEYENYNSITFRVGLSNEQNSTVPQDYPSSNVLSESGEYWSNWNSYVFVKIEGRIDLDGDGQSDSFALHLGGDDVSRVEVLGPLEGQEKVFVDINVEEIFKNGPIYDIDSNPRIHTLEQMEQIIQLMDNLKKSMEGAN